MPPPETKGSEDVLRGGVHRALAHDSAAKHVSGTARYVDDLIEPPGTLHIGPGGASIAHGQIVGLDLAEVAASDGVVLVLTADDIPGRNDVSPTGTNDDPVLADGIVHFVGQPVFVAVAESFEQAREAATKAKIEYRELEPILTVEQALAQGSFINAPHVMRQGDAAAALAAAPHRLQGQVRSGGQDHFYLEGQVSLALPMEDGDVVVHTSSQHPSEVQHNVAKVLGRPDNAVTVEVRRMGGAFGGKETQAAQWAALAALAAVRTGRAVKARLDRDDDMVMTGKRHDFVTDFDVGFDAEGRILGIEMILAANCGFSADLSNAIADRAMFHADNCYFLEHATITCHRCRTNLVSNTAFRGFGGPQGMIVIENVIDAIARALGKDPFEVRRLNFYGEAPRNVTPYHMTIEDNCLPEVIDELERDSGYWARRAAITDFNRHSKVIKKGLALTPVKFGISFTTLHLNQAGALLHVYTDGSVHLNHGGTEMGQGLFIKVAQVVAEELQLDLERIKITATNTGKVPNTSATAASSGSDINGMAALAAARSIRERLAAFAAERYQVPAETIVFRANHVHVGGRAVPFAELVKQAYMARVQLSATGFYATPKIHYDRETASGRPFYYFAYGAAVSEVSIDTLTGEMMVDRVDIVHDVGRSLNSAVDLGQVEGGFIQGMGWLTTEELWWDEKGRLWTHAPSTYKIPACSDRPEIFNMKLLASGRNREDTIHRSKAVGEPPLMLGISVYQAIRDAVSSLSDYRLAPSLHAPATPEAILAAVTEIQDRAALAGPAKASALGD